MGVTVPPGVNHIGYADDLVVLVTDKEQDMLAHRTSPAVKSTLRWMQGAGLQLATHKIEAVILTGWKLNTPVRFKVGIDWIETCGKMIYLGVVIQGKLSFIKHVEMVSQKAKRIATALAHITSTVGGAGMLTRRCFYEVSEPILLYVSSNWDRASNFAVPRRKMRSAQKVAPDRVARAYKTFSWDALCVLMGISPIDLVAKERKNIFLRRWPNNPPKPPTVDLLLLLLFISYAC